jgi:S-adenosylmethionine synthetase
MNFLKSAFYLLFSLILFLISIFMVLIGFMVLDEQFTAVIIHTITGINAPGLFIGGGIIIFLLSLIVYGLSGRGNNQPTSFTLEGERGPITISLRAIEDYINRYLDEQHIANSVKTKIATSKNRQNIIIRASVSAWSEQNLKYTGDTVQREIAARLKEGLGLENTERIVVSVDKIITSKSSRSALPRPHGDDVA